MKKLIAAVDLGHFKAYRLSKNPNESARIEMLESYDIVDTHGRLLEKFTDAEGCFERGAGKSVTQTGSGEPRNLELEIEKKVIRRIANDINLLVKKEGCEKWYLAAAERINNQIIENLDPSVRAKLAKNVRADLTKIAKSEILKHFES